MILFIEPSGATTDVPTIDQYTRKMTAAVRRALPPMGHYMGVHQCACGAVSTSFDYFLPNGQQTNSLCVHYLACHRSEVPDSEIEKVAALDCGEADPTGEELRGRIALERRPILRVQAVPVKAQASMLRRAWRRFVSGSNERD
jgi:hypothetical protein